MASRARWRTLRRYGALRASSRRKRGGIIRRRRNGARDAHAIGGGVMSKSSAATAAAAAAPSGKKSGVLSGISQRRVCRKQYAPYDAAAGIYRLTLIASRRTYMAPRTCRKRKCASDFWHEAAPRRKRSISGGVGAGQAKRDVMGQQRKRHVWGRHRRARASAYARRSCPRRLRLVVG